MPYNHLNIEEDKNMVCENQLSVECQDGMADIVLRIVERELRQTQEVPAIVDLMVKHEVMLSYAEGLESPSLRAEKKGQTIEPSDLATLLNFATNDLAFCMGG